MNKVRSDVYFVGAILSLGLSRLAYEVSGVWTISLVLNGLLFAVFAVFLECKEEK